MRSYVKRWDITIAVRVVRWGWELGNPQWQHGSPLPARFSGLLCAQCLHLPPISDFQVGAGRTKGLRAECLSESVSTNGT
jgi:hypothetical protein